MEGELDAGVRWCNFPFLTKLEKSISPLKAFFIFCCVRSDKPVIIIIASHQKSGLKNSRVENADAVDLKPFHKFQQVLRMGDQRGAIRKHDPIQLDVLINFGDNSPVFCSYTDTFYLSLGF